MNRAYRLVWNEQQGTCVVAPETARSRGKRGGTQAAVTVSALATGLVSFAAASANLPGTLPTGGQVSAGQASIATRGSTMTVTQGSQRAAIDWQGFSVGSGASVRFQQPNASAVTLNRVVGSEQSFIDGALAANGQVFLLNSNGVLFGRGAQVDVGGLVASTLSLSDVDFMAGRATFTANGSRASVVNLGTLRAADGGYVALLGNQASNQGVISARLGTAALAAGDRISLNFNGNSLVGVAIEQGTLDALVENRQAVHADGGQVILTAQGLDAVLASAVNNTGEIRARTVANQAGRIVLLGDMQTGSTNVGGTLDASAPDGGDGGFIETSAAHVKVQDGTRITTLAPQGRTGTWLVDPSDFTVAPSAGGTVTAGSPSGDISGATLSAALASSDVTLESSLGSTASGTGSIHVNDTVSWSANRLTLTAANNVNVNAPMTASGSASLTLNPATANGADSAVPNGTVNIGMEANGAFAGKVNFSGSGSLTIGGQVYTVINSLGAQGSATGTDLQGINGARGGKYALGSDIDAAATAGWNSGSGFTPLGDNSTAFSGVFDGLGHVVSNLTINQPSAQLMGLFGRASGATLRNVGVENASVAGGINVGALVGYVISGRISNSYASGTVSSTLPNSSRGTGGLVGQLLYTSLSNSHSSGVVNGVSAVGGLVGTMSSSTISGSYSDSDVTASGSASGISGVGGLVGEVFANNGSAIIANSYSTGAVVHDTTGTASSYAGGLVGTLRGSSGMPPFFPSSTSYVLTSYASGAVSGTNAQQGALVGYVSLGTVTSSFYDKTVNPTLTGIRGLPDSAGIAYGMSTADMKNSANYTSATAANGNVNPYWDFTTGTGIWGRKDSLNNGYPVLRQYGYRDTTALTVTLNDLALSRTYGDANPSLAGAWSVSGCSGCLDGLGWGSAMTTATGVGTYAYSLTNLFSPVFASGFSASDFSVSFTAGSITVNARPVTVGVVPNASRTYDGTTTAAASLLAIQNAVNGDTVSLGGSTTLAGRNVGSQALSGLGNLTVSNPNYTMTGGSASGSVAITPAPLAVSASGGTQVYDATTNASVTLASNALIGDTVTLARTAATLADKNAGTGKTVSVTGISIGGADAGNYALQNTTASTTTDVTPAPLTVTATGGSQVYDATINANVTLGSDAFQGDALTLSRTAATLADKNAGTGKAVSVAGISIGGADAGNYALQNTTASTTTDVTPAALTVTATGGTQVYDASSNASVTLGSNAFQGDTLTLSRTAATLADKNAGTGKTVSVAGISIGGADAGNYALQNTTASTTTDVTPASLTVTATGGTQVYDATTNASVTLASNALIGDTVTLARTAATLADKNAGTGKAVSVAGISIGGADAGNYALQNTTAITTTDVTPAALTVTATGGTQVYDATTNASVTLGSNVFVGDTLTLSRTAATLLDKNVSTGKAVSVTGISIAGADANNYALQNTTASTTTSVTPASLTVTATGGTQVYDATTGASVTLGSNAFVGDTLTLSRTAATLLDKNIGQLKPVSITGISIAGADAGNYALQNTTAGTFTNVTPAALTVTATGGTQVYDATTSASVTLGSNAFVGDALTLSNAAATLASKNVGTGKAVSVTGISIAGADANNYALQNTTASTTTSVTPASLTVTATGGTQVYDATTNASVTLGSNAFVGDTLTLSRTAATLLDKNVGQLKPVSITGISIAGADAGNYALQNTTAGTFTNVTPAALTVSATGGTQVYDATTNASVTLGSNAFVGDTLTLSRTAATLLDKNVGQLKPVSITGISIAGADAGNYALQNTTAGTFTNVTPAALTVTATGGTQVYDGTSNASVTLASNAFQGDTLALSRAGATMADRNVGTGKAVSVTGISIGGTDAGNYSLQNTAASTSTNVAPLPVAVTALPSATKTYDGMATAPASLLGVTNVLGGDTVALSGTATLAGSGVGSQSIGLGGLILGNANYTLTGGLPSGSVLVTPRPVNVAVLTGGTKIFDGTTAALANLLTVTNVVPGDSVILSGSALLSGSGTGSQPLASLTGLSVSNANYTLSEGQASGSVNVTPDTVMNNTITNTVQIQPARAMAPVIAGNAGGDSARASGGFANVVFVPTTVTATFGNGTPLALVSTPNANEPTQAVSLSDARAMLGGSAAAAPGTAEGTGVARPRPGAQPVPGGTAGPTREVRVPVSRNSLAEIVNGGVRLPSGVEQQIFVVKGN